MALSLRKIHIDGQEWKWYLKDGVVIFSPEKKRTLVEFGTFELFCRNFYDDFALNKDGRFAITPGRISDYIESEILDTKSYPYDGLNDEEKLAKAERICDNRTANEMREKIEWDNMSTADKKAITHYWSVKEAMSDKAWEYIRSREYAAPGA